MRSRRRRNIIIELTSLLDVIMIMIFMVMAENSKLIAEQRTALDGAASENAQQSGTIEDLTGELDKLNEDYKLAMDKLEEGGTEELLQRLSDAESKLKGYEYMNDIVIVINVELENRYNNAVRVLSFGSSSDNGEKPNVHEIREDEEFGRAVNELKVKVSEYISQVVNDETNSTIAYIIFSYDPEKVFQDDYAAVDRALGNIEIKSNSGNVRYRLNPLNASE